MTIENFAIPHNLKLAAQKNQLIIFVGAGISRGEGLPTWSEIVKKTLSDPAVRKGRSYIAALDDEILTPLEALDKIKGENVREVYKHFETETCKIIESKIYQTIASISTKIITTNYDQLIEYNTRIPVIDTNSPYNLQKLDTYEDFILKIHGSTNSIDNAVIFTSDYEKLYGNANELASFQLEKLVSSHSCLFLGFSLSDNYVTSLFDRLNNMYKGLGKEHYIISTTDIHHDFVELIKIANHQLLPLILEVLASHKTIPLEPSLSTIISDNPALNTLPESGIQIHLGQDTPPQVDYWTGRTAELRSLEPPHKVCFITGIGGQGKSALASKYLSTYTEDDSDFADWRDFKEEELNLQSKLFQLVELVSNQRVLPNRLAGLETENLIELFFQELGTQKGIFVFDNVDKYIDLQKFIPLGDMALFVNKALKTQHNSKFIFTCRPFIHQATIGFYQVQLEGLGLIDTKELIQKYHSKVEPEKLEEIALQLHSSTNGHPLWMGLILAQSRSDIRQIQELISKVNLRQTDRNSNISSLVSETILENAWSSLKDREKIVLRTLSISSISETADDLATIIANKLNYNQYTKALKSLKSLNLIVTKASDHLELHPLVREFIKSNYGKEDQESYISLYVRYLDGFIILLKNKFGNVLSRDELGTIIKKIEVLIGSDKIQEAVNELRTTGDSFQISGYCEEYLRLTDQILSQNIWSTSKISKIHGFSDFIFVAFTRMADFGNFSMFDIHMSKFRATYTEPDRNMILAKSALCHRYWACGEYEQAILQGRSAADLIDLLGEFDTRQGKNRLYLALRDSGIQDNLQEALTYFSEGRTVESLSLEDCTPNNSSQYGNVGRCLALLNKPSDALYLIAMSYRALNSEKNNFYNKHNLGFASKWIAETLDSIEKTQAALYFYLNARNIWKNDMPIEANLLESAIAKKATSASHESIISLESWQITKFCDEWIDHHFSPL